MNLPTYQAQQADLRLNREANESELCPECGRSPKLLRDSLNRAMRWMCRCGWSQRVSR